MDTESRELATIPPTDIGQIVPTSASELIPSGRDCRTWASFPLASLADKIRAVNAMNGAAVAMGDLNLQTIVVRDIVASDSEWTDATTGELIKAVRICLIREDGTIVATVSETARQALGRILSACPPPWPDGLPILITKGESNNKRPVYSLTIDALHIKFDVGAEPQPKKRK